MLNYRWIEIQVSKFLDHIFLFSALSRNTTDAYASDLRNLINFYKESENIFEIKTIQEYIRQLNARDLKKTSLNRNYSSIRKFLLFLIETDATNIDYNSIIFPKIKKDNRLPKILSRKEIQSMLDVVIENKNPFYNLRKNAIIALFYSSGMRVSELCGLKIKDISPFIKKPSPDSVSFIKILGKGKKERLVTIFPKCKLLLEKYINHVQSTGQELNETGYLFISRYRKTITRRAVVDIIKSTALQCNIYKTISPHTLRHSFASHLLEDGLDVREIQELLGHSDISTTSIYTNINVKKLKSVLDVSHPIAIDSKEFI